MPGTKDINGLIYIMDASLVWRSPERGGIHFCDAILAQGVLVRHIDRAGESPTLSISPVLSDQLESASFSRQG
jgi:hypothetical protein